MVRPENTHTHIYIYIMPVQHKLGSRIHAEPSFDPCAAQVETSVNILFTAYHVIDLVSQWADLT